jgi:hypothetical protein
VEGYEGDAADHVRGGRGRKTVEEVRERVQERTPKVEAELFLVIRLEDDVTRSLGSEVGMELVLRTGAW